MRSEVKKYYNYDDIEYKWIREIQNLFNKLIDEDYYKPIRNITVFDNKNNYIEFESKGDKDKTLSVKEYHDMIRPFLSNMINDHKTQGKWAIQLTVSNSYNEYQEP